jgi:hypothetical protein
MHTQTRVAPFTSRADHQKPTRSAPARMGQFRHHAKVAPTPQRLPTQGASSLAACVPDPCSPAASAQRPSAAERAPRERVHTSQPLAGVCACPLRAVRRHAEPERAAPRRRRTQTRAAPFTSRAEHQGPTRSAREVCSTRLGATSQLAAGTPAYRLDFCLCPSRRADRRSRGAVPPPPSGGAVPPTPWSR